MTTERRDEAPSAAWRFLKIAAEQFVAKVDRGEAKSRRSYADFKHALELIAGSTASTADVEGLSEEAIAETLWQAEYLRATGKHRSVDWLNGVADSNKENYRFVARAIIDRLTGGKA